MRPLPLPLAMHMHARSQACTTSRALTTRALSCACTLADMVAQEVKDTHMPPPAKKLKIPEPTVSNLKWFSLAPAAKAEVTRATPQFILRAACLAPSSRTLLRLRVALVSLPGQKHVPAHAWPVALTPLSGALRRWSR